MKKSRIFKPKEVLIALATASVIALSINSLIKQYFRHKPTIIYVDIPSPKSYLDIPEKNLENLVVNAQCLFRSVVNKDEKQGISDLKDLALCSEYEEAWAYLPKLVQWQEVGRESLGFNLEKALEEIRTTAEKIYLPDAVSIDQNLVSQLIDESDELVFYHLHPSRGEQLAKIANRMGLEKQEEVLKFSAVAMIQYTIPSQEDIVYMIMTDKEFYKKNPNGKITFKIASPSGITEYGLTKEGRKFFAEKDIDEIQKYLEGKTKQVSLNLDDFDFKELAGFKEKFDAKIKELFESIKSDEHYMRFNTYSQVLSK